MQPRAFNDFSQVFVASSVKPFSPHPLHKRQHIAFAFALRQGHGHERESALGRFSYGVIQTAKRNVTHAGFSGSVKDDVHAFFTGDGQPAHHHGQNVAQVHLRARAAR